MENKPYCKPQGLDDSIKDKEYIGFLLDVWKKTVDVQMHFNQLSLQVRNFLITLFGGILTAFYLFLKDERYSDSVGLMFIALPVLVAMYIMDYLWYHRFLVSSVRHANKIEGELKSIMPNIDLGNTIRKESAIPFEEFWLGNILLKWKLIKQHSEEEQKKGKGVITSKERLKLYYFLLFSALVLPIIVVNFLYPAPGKKTEQEQKTAIAITVQDSSLLKEIKRLNGKLDSIMLKQN